MKLLLVACLLLAACADEGTDSSATDLTGPIACGESSCDDGDLCVTIPSPTMPPPGYDDTECWRVPAGCAVSDCHEDDGPNCAQCVNDVWYPCAWVVLEGRELLCVTN